MAQDTRKHKAKKKQKTERSRPVSSISRSLPFWQNKKEEAVCVRVRVCVRVCVRVTMT